MGEVIGWLGANWMTMVTVVCAVVTGASIIVKAIAPLTASKRDDEFGVWLSRVQGWLSKIALNTNLPVKK